MIRRLTLSCLALLGAAALAQADQGNPMLKTIEAIAFGPNGLLVIGSGSQVVTVETGDTKEMPWSKSDIAGFDKLLADKLGTTPKDIEISRLAVNPASHKAYLAVRSLKSNQYVILTVDGGGKVGEFSLENVKFERYPLNVGKKAVTKITDVVWAGGKIVAATQASDVFASRVFTIMPGKEASSFYTETFHTGHNKIETKAPILCLMAYEEGPKTQIVGSFTCTPLVKYPLDDAMPDVKVKGTTVVELGQGNQPRSMFPYEKDGKKYILVNVFRKFNKNPVGPSADWVAKVDYDLLKETVNVDDKALWRVDPKGKASVSVTDRAVIAPAYFGVVSMAKLDSSNALVIRDDKGSMSLRVLPLP
jgi:hypothetical protein